MASRRSAIPPAGNVLRDAGYTVNTAEIWYDQPRRRITVPITDAAIGNIQDLLERLWRTAATDTAPPPSSTAPNVRAAHSWASAYPTRPMPCGPG